MRTTTARPSGSLALCSTGPCRLTRELKRRKRNRGVRRRRHAAAVIPERLVRVRVRTILAILGIVLSTRSCSISSGSRAAS